MGVFAVFMGLSALPAHAQDSPLFANVVADAPTLPRTGMPDSDNRALAGPASTYFPILPYDSDPDTPPQLLPVASNHPLDGDNSNITRAIIVIHDVNRDAGGMLAMLTSLGAAGDATTLIMAPQFLLESDIAHFSGDLPGGGNDLVRWPLGVWEDGGDSSARHGQKGISSFTAMDMLFMFLAEREYFPSLSDIVLTGHGAGGDFTLRYAATGQAPDLVSQTGINIRFVAANPASFLFFTPLRPQSKRAGFARQDIAQCPLYNSYKYGLENLNAYARRTGASAIQLRYATRHVIYIDGEKVAAGDRFPDSDCAALLQGPDRLSRMMNYNMYINTIFGEDLARTQTFATVPKAGYSPAAIYGSRCGMDALFGAGACAPEAIRGKEIQ